MSAQQQISQVAVTALAPDPEQPRRAFHAEPLAQLADNIRARGVLQPITARQIGAQLVIKSGERRWRAAQMAGLETVPVIVVNEESAGDLLVDQVVENELREGLTPLEIAGALAKLRDQGMGPGAIRDHLQAHGINYSRPHISNMLRLLELPAWASEMLEAGKITPAHAKHILSAKDEPEVLELVRKDVVGRLEDSEKYGEPFTASDVEDTVTWARRDFARESQVASSSAAPQPPAVERAETDPTKVTPLTVKLTKDGLVKLQGRYEECSSLDSAQFDTAKHCTDCPHKHLGSYNGKLTDELGSMEACFYIPCFDHLQLLTSREQSRVEKFKLALDVLVHDHLQALICSVDIIPSMRRVQEALVAYMFAGQPLAAERPSGNDHIEHGYDFHRPYADAAKTWIWNLSQALTEYTAASPAPRQPLAAIALSRLHHEQRRELARWLKIPLERIYGPTEAIAKLYRKAELIERIDPDHKSTGWSPALPQRPTSELRAMFLEHCLKPPADLLAIWDSPIANLNETDTSCADDDEKSEDEAA